MRSARALALEAEAAAGAFRGLMDAVLGVLESSVLPPTPPPPSPLSPAEASEISLVELIDPESPALLSRSFDKICFHQPTTLDSRSKEISMSTSIKSFSFKVT
jgi:hypothetical protein